MTAKRLAEAAGIKLRDLKNLREEAGRGRFGPVRIFLDHQNGPNAWILAAHSSSDEYDHNAMRNRYEQIIAVLQAVAESFEELPSEFCEVSPPKEVTMMVRRPDRNFPAACFSLSKGGKVTLEVLDETWADLARSFFKEGAPSDKEHRLVLPAEGEAFRQALLQPRISTTYSFVDTTAKQ